MCRAVNFHDGDLMHIMIEVFLIKRFLFIREQDRTLTAVSLKPILCILGYFSCEKRFPGPERDVVAVNAPNSELESDAGSVDDPFGGDRLVTHNSEHSPLKVYLQKEEDEQN